MEEPMRCSGAARPSMSAPMSTRSSWLSTSHLAPPDAPMSVCTRAGSKPCLRTSRKAEGPARNRSARDAVIGLISRRKERANLREKREARRVLFQEQVIVAFERHEPRAGNAGGQLATIGVGDARVLAAVEHQRGLSDLTQAMRDVDVAERVDEPRRVLGRGRLALQLVQPVRLLRRCAGNEQ